MKLFEKNHNKSEKVLRVIITFFLVQASIVFGPTLYSSIVPTVEIILFFNAITGTCIIYKVLGINTCEV